MKKTQQMSFVSSQSYRKWIAELKKRYRATQCKAAVAVNSAMLEFYGSSGKSEKACSLAA